MIERKFVAQKFKEFHIKQYLKHELKNVGLSDVKLQRTSMGEKILISANRPGLVVGRGGAVIQNLTKVMRSKFKLENPEIEIEEVKDVNLDADIVAENIATQLEKFGSQRFKGIGHKTMTRVMDSGALGVEILISGKIPSSRAKTWRFALGYMKKCGDVAITGVNSAKTSAMLKTGLVGIQVRIMPATTILPDKITLLNDVTIDEIPTVTVSEKSEDTKKRITKESKEKETKEKSAKKRTPKKTSTPRKPKKTSEESESSEKIVEDEQWNIKI